jgi:hypothetical protein
MNKKEIKKLVLRYDKLFDKYSKQMLWLCNNESLPKKKKMDIAANITLDTFYSLLWINVCLNIHTKKRNKSSKAL